MSTSSIDELLLSGGNASQPKPVEEISDGTSEIEELEPETEPANDEPEPEPLAAREDDSEEKPAKTLRETDEYGNEKEPENEVIRERLKKQAESMNRRHQAEIDTLRSQLASSGASQQVQQAASDFEYDPEARGDWQQQLASFVKQTVNSMSREQEDNRYRQQEKEVQNEFESKLISGMSNFHDFQDVIRALPCDITNPMTLATRAMNDPAAFLYAAAKRHPQELERISKLRDPYAQMTEIGKLEERMKKNTPGTKAPRPLGRTAEDSHAPSEKKKKETTIEDMIAQADKRKLAAVKGRSRGGRR